MSSRKRWIILMPYLCFCFPVFTKCCDCSSGTHRKKHIGPSAQNETRQTAQRRFFSRAHYRRSSSSPLSSFFQLCLCVTSHFHLQRWMYLLSFSSPLCFAWIFFSPLVPFACSSRYSSKGEYSQEVNHAPQTQAPNHIWLCRRTSFPFLISDPAVLLWDFQSLYISKKDTTGGLFAET